jgi:hypothetical protein
MQTHTKQQSSWEAHGWLAGQEIPCLIWNPKVNSCALHWTLSWARWIHSTTSHLVPLFKIYFSIILPSMPRFFHSDFPAKIVHVCTSYIPPCVLHILPLFDDPNNIWKSAVLLITLISPCCCYFPCLKCIYSSWHQLLKHPQSLWDLRFSQLWT